MNPSMRSCTLPGFGYPKAGETLSGMNAVHARLGCCSLFLEYRGFIGVIIGGILRLCRIMEKKMETTIFW